MVLTGFEFHNAQIPFDKNNLFSEDTSWTHRLSPA
jgi:hypothetical protein